MRKHFVTFLSPGTFVSEETTNEISDWCPTKAQAMSTKITKRYHTKPYAFYFTTRENKGELDSKETKRSGIYFLGGKIYTLADVKREMPNERILISNMECNKIEKVIVNTNSWKITVPFEKGDILLCP